MKKPKPKPKCHKKRKTRVVKEKKYILHRCRWCMTRKCLLCGKKFASTQALNIHVTDKHEYKFLYKFRKCRSEYSSQTLADRHIRHHSPPRYQCEHCGKQFHEKYVLEAHTNVHTEKGYECTYPKCHRIYKSPAGTIGISRNIVHQGFLQNAVCVTGLSRKKNTWMNI